MPQLREHTVDEFLSYNPSGRKGDFLSGDWKKSPGYIQVWLHRRRTFVSGWEHQIPRIDIRDDKVTGLPKKMIFGGHYACLEEEDVLEEQWKRSRETGERKTPPRLCPICKAIEHIHMMVIRQEMHWLQPIFEFDVGDRDSYTLLRATGLWNGYKLKNMNDEQKQQLAEAGIQEKFGWKENIQAGLKYIFCLVDHNAVAKGVQIMKEGQGLGDKVKLAIAREMKRNPRDPRVGSPVDNPYPFQFSYEEKATPDKKYDAFRVDLEITDEILRLITETDPPSLEMLSGLYVPGTLRAQLEAAVQIDGLPWDDFFTEDAEKALESLSEEKPKAAPKPVAPRAHLSVPVRAPAALRPSVPPARVPFFPSKVPPTRTMVPVKPAPVEDEVMCDACGKAMLVSSSKCPHCGQEYEVEVAPVPPPPPLRRRSEVQRAAPKPVAPSVPQARARPVQQPAPAVAEEDPGFGDFGDSDEIPF
jgi:hypothetical protein